MKLKQQMDFVDLLSQSLKKGQIAAKESSSSSFLHVFERLCTKVPSDREQKLLHLDTKEEHHTPIKGRFRVWPSRHFVTVV